MPLPLRPFIALVAAVAAVVAACADDNDVVDDVVDGAAAQKPRVTPVLTVCDNDGIACGFVDVPIDPDDPHSATLQIAIKIRTASPAERTGTLFVNLGGPAESLSSFARFYAKLPESIRRQFDVVTFDRRGVGDSKPAVVCPALAEELDRLWTRSYGEMQRDLDDVRALARACAADSGGALSALGTQRAAEDMDAIRVALGADEISFYGASYGTLLGAAYAATHGDRLRALVLDSVVPLTPTFTDVDEAQHEGEFHLAKTLPPSERQSVEAVTRSFGRRLSAQRAMEERCNQDPKCPAYPDAAGRVRALNLRVNHTKDVPGVDIRVLSTLEEAVYTAGPKVQRRYFAAIVEGDGAELARKLLALQKDLGLDAKDPPNVFNRAVRCADGFPDEPLLDDVIAESASGQRVRVPACQAMHIEAEPIKFSRVFPPRVTTLVLTSDNDVRTPQLNAHLAASALEAPVVTWHGVGHGVLTKSPCAAKIVEDFLVAGARPDGDVDCAATQR